MQRARIILLSNQGYLMREIAEELGCHEKTASRWIGRFNELGMAGLEEYPRGGRPRVYSPEEVGTVIQTALTNGDGRDDFLVLNDNGSVVMWINQGGDPARTG